MKASWVEQPTRDHVRKLIDASASYNRMGDGELQFDSDGTFAIVYRRDENIVAGAIAVIVHDWAYVETVWVDDSLRGQGIGRKLMLAVESYAKQIGLNGIWLYTIDFQAPDFYRKLGYQQIGILPNRPQGHRASYFAKTDLITTALTDEFTVENPVTQASFEIIEDGLVAHANDHEPIVAYERVLELFDADGQLCGGMFAHEFWGYMDVHLLYAHDDEGLRCQLQALRQYCDDHTLGALIHTFSDAHSQIVADFGYQPFAQLPDYPTGTVGHICLYPQPTT